MLCILLVILIASLENISDYSRSIWSVDIYIGWQYFFHSFIWLNCLFICLLNMETREDSPTFLWWQASNLSDTKRSNLFQVQKDYNT